MTLSCGAGLPDRPPRRPPSGDGGPPQPRGEPEHRREVVQPADLPTSPASPDLVRNGLLALAVGLALGIGVAFVRERLDERLRGREDFEAQIAAPVLATVLRVRGDGGDATATWSRP